MSGVGGAGEGQFSGSAGKRPRRLRDAASVSREQLRELRRRRGLALERWTDPTRAGITGDDLRRPESPVLRAIATAVFMTVAAGAAFVWAVFTTFRVFAGGVPTQFWVLAALAVLIDIPLFIDQRDDVRIRSTLSICVCFAILLMWGAGPAIVVQAIAGIVTTIGQRYFVQGSLFFVDRLILSFAATGALTGLKGSCPEMLPGTAETSAQVFWFVQLAGTWLLVTYAVLLTSVVVVSRRLVPLVARQLPNDLFVTVASILLATPLLVALPGWWNLLVVPALVSLNLALGERIRHERRLRRDPVTGLQNLHGMRGYLDAATMTDVIRTTAIAVMVITARAIPEVSRSLGREVYDGIVCEAARRLQAVWGRERVGRLFGEGIVVTVTGPAALDPARTAHEVSALLRTPGEVKGIPFAFDPVVGVALSPEHGRDFDTLLAKAYLAMTEALRRDQPVVIYDSAAATAASRRAELLAELRDVLCDPSRQVEIALAYQPQVDLCTGQLAGVEGLLRWTHPVWGPVSPEELIEAVETSQVMYMLTRHVINTAVAQVRAWNDRGLQTRVSINASVQDLNNPGFPDDIEAALAAHGVPPGQLNIEITERVILLGGERLTRTATRIANLGVGVSIDDFGTGHASMHQLRILPVTEVKIDQSYVAAMLTSPFQRAIVTGVHQLAGSLGLRLVAEGVENAETAAALAEMPGMIGQGFHFGRPMPADRLYDQWYAQRSAGPVAR